MTTRQELRVYLIATLIACVSGGVTALVATKTITPTTLTLEGEEDEGLSGTPRVIHYKSRFASPPYLTFPNGQLGYEITKETAESFTVRQIAYGEGINATLKWKAEGQPAGKDTAADSGGKS